MLAKRLISDTSASEDAEESMITKLKEACGFEYTVKLQRMFNDMQTSRDLYANFKSKFLDQNFDIGVDLSVLVLCTSAWPLSPPSHPFTIPQSLEKGITLSQQFYQNQHSGRRLHWLYNLAKGEVKANYFKHTKAGYTLQVSTFQMSVLLQYNNADNYTYDELAANTSVSAEVLKQILEILVKAKILLQEGNKYRLNYDFKSKKYRVNLNVPLKSEAKQELDETHQHVQEDRKLLIQAAIVRVMKTRKTSNYNTLVGEVITQLQARFSPTIPDIKKCIDILIEKEYLERVQGQKDTFNYLA
jgi:cullin 1